MECHKNFKLYTALECVIDVGSAFIAEICQAAPSHLSSDYAVQPPDHLQERNGLLFFLPLPSYHDSATT